MKEKYIEASIDIVEFVAEDVITTSDPWGGADDTDQIEPMIQIR